MLEQMTWTEWLTGEAEDQAEVVEEVAQEETGVGLVEAEEHWALATPHCVFAEGEIKETNVSGALVGNLPTYTT